MESLASNRDHSFELMNERIHVELALKDGRFAVLLFKMKNEIELLLLNMIKYD